MFGYFTPEALRRVADYCESKKLSLEIIHCGDSSVVCSGLNKNGMYPFCEQSNPLIEELKDLELGLYEGYVIHSEEMFTRISEEDYKQMVVNETTEELILESRQNWSECSEEDARLYGKPYRAVILPLFIVH